MKAILFGAIIGALVWLVSEFADAVGDFCDDVMWRD